MARWDPGAEERLKKAALELFTEHGYDNVTVTRIAERAGLTRRSFFRYFPDKREVLFAGSEQLPPAVASAVLAVAPGVAPLDAVLDALTSVGTRLAERVDGGRTRRAVIAASAELRERERTKFAAVTAAIRDALVRRGTDPDTAALLARTATVAFRHAFERWTESDGRTSFAECVDAVVATLRDAFTTRARAD
ncbi:TetR family transcriptional regulator [Streptomyces montanisoli]|uniref:TetR family transcriptional regulator n=1 Tax=Streptomyces montanisoli TaxID=2798581 RepID=A0A940MJR9_9ACTN|nr:TetR family transcriptional regulator [Streptomyces montanisoli]MBP0461022.1 TetR family transcriptional regulator [Streptomyces montanisoli]